MRSVPVLLLVCSLLAGDHARGDAAPATPARAPAPPPVAAPAPAPLRFTATETPAAEVPAPPFTLTASDGSGLELTRLEARAVVEGPLAYTELHLDFHNPEDRVREGTFAITLPAGAAVSRFSMEQGGRWQEAAVVERPLARRVYDDFLHRRQDPALLEKAAGNQFTARVFPIPPRADKRLIVSFSQELDGRPYALPLRGLPRVAAVDVSLADGSAGGAPVRRTLAERDWQPDRDFVAPAAPLASSPAVGAAGMVVATVRFTTGAITVPIEAPRKLIVAVDTSASRALGFARHVRSVRELIAALRARHGDAIDVEVIAFDQDTQVVYDGPAAGYGDDAERALLARGAAGASDLEALTTALAASPRTAGRRLALITDGVMTAGADTAAVIAAAGKLPLERIDVVLAGGIRDRELAAALVRARPHAGDVFDSDEGAAAIADGLGQPVAVDVAVRVPGATWVYPSTIPSIRPGRAVTIHARVPGARASVELDVGGHVQAIAVVPATPALVERALAAAELAELEARLAATTDAAAARALREDVARRSVSARVLSSQTSMLVLESDADYQRYGIDPSTVAGVLAIGPRGLEAQRPAAIATATTAAPPAKLGAKDDAEDDAPPVAYPLTLRGAAAADDDSDDDDSGGTGSAMALDEGRMGRADRAQDVEAARTAGLLGAGDLASGLTDDDRELALAPPPAPEDDPTLQGGFGLAGPGGGGTATGTIGLGRYGTIGHGSGTAAGSAATAAGYGVGSGRGAMRGRSASAPAVRIGAPAVQGSLDAGQIRRQVRRVLPRLRTCYERELVATPALTGTVTTRFTILPDGRVTAVSASGLSPSVASCVTSVLQTLRFPAIPGGGAVQISYPFAFAPAGGDATAATTGGNDDDVDRGPPALTGELADVMAAIAAKDPARALTLARTWHDRAPGDVLALIALGEAQEAGRDVAGAARSYGSIIDLFPGRADLRRFAGERLERLGTAAGARALAIDTYRKAVADRPDHLTGHRLLAHALLRAGDHAGAFAAILAGVDAPIGDGRFAGADRILDEDAGLIAAAWLAAGGPRATITAELARRKLAVASAPSTRLVLYWETDANDVDLHIRDARGDHAYYSSRELPSGGSLYADVTTGYGPECFTIPGTPSAGPYRIAADYFARGPMGYGMGLLQIERFDGKQLTFEDRPYVIMNDHAMVDLGTL